MDAGLKMEIVQDKFNAMLAELAAIDPSVEFADVIKSEAASVISTALARTDAADVAKIRNRSNDREWTTFNGKKYREAVWRLPTPIYQEIQRLRRQFVEIKLASRGLAKKSWYHLAQQIGRQARAPAYVVGATYRGREYPVDADHKESGSGSDYALMIINSSPIVGAAHGRPALEAAMYGRISYFQRNMEHHAFRTVETRARAYPGIFTSTVPPAAD